MIVGTWAALALDAVRNRFGKTLIQTVFMLPIAVPSVVVGLALLVTLTGSLALCFALSTGELGATAMVYSADWTTLPLRIYALDDRGHQFVAAAVTVVMMTITLGALLMFSRIRTRANYR